MRMSVWLKEAPRGAEMTVYEVSSSMKVNREKAVGQLMKNGWFRTGRSRAGSFVYSRQRTVA